MVAMSLAAVLLLLAGLTSSGCGIELDVNGYRNVLVAINPAIPENPMLIERIKEMLLNGSTYLHMATKKKFFLKEATILVPPNWEKGNYSRASTEVYDKANIIIDKPNIVYGNNPYTLQYGQCGDPAQYIHFTPEFMLNDTFIKQYGPRERVFVHEWAHLRWGVYDEYDEHQPFYLVQGKLEATRCSKDIKGKIKKQSNPTQDCAMDSLTGLPTDDCAFFPERNQKTTASIMFLQSLDSVKDFCTKDTHNSLAPNMQNRMCDGRGAEEVIGSSSVDSAVYNPLPPIDSPPPTSITVVKRPTRVVCLVLDVSGSMSSDNKILKQRQAATLFIEKIIEDKAKLGIVTFNDNAVVKAQLTLIDGKATRDNLVKQLPTSAGGWTELCRGLEKGLEVLRKDDGSTRGEEIIFLTDGLSDVNCFDQITSSKVIVHSIALGKDANKEILDKMANISGGHFFYVGDKLDSNALIDVFSSLTTSDGDLSQQTIQVESLGSTISGFLNGSASIDRTIGRNTSFLVIFGISAPDIVVTSPSGTEHTTSQFIPGSDGKSLTLDIPGIAEPGKWMYSLQNKHTSSQSMSITVTSKAVSADIAPVTVKPHIKQLSNDGSKPLVVYAEVSQKGVPVILANVTATLEAENGKLVHLNLSDDGAGADAFRNDGIYSKFFMPTIAGRYSLKVRVENDDGKARYSLKRHSGALYIPGYVEDDGKVSVNPPKPPVSEDDQQADVGSFTRTALGESFSVQVSPTGPPKFPPNKITDLRAEINESTVRLTWTAPGDDFDIGKAKAYEIHFSEDPEQLRKNFTTATPLNMSSLTPQESGSREQFSFDTDIKNGTTLFFAAKAQDNDTLSSDLSNLAQVTKFVPKAPVPPPPPPGTDGVDILAIVVSVSTVTLVACLVASVAMYVTKRRRAIRA